MFSLSLISSSSSLFNLRALPLLPSLVLLALLEVGGVFKSAFKSVALLPPEAATAPIVRRAETDEAAGPVELLVLVLVVPVLVLLKVVGPAAVGCVGAECESDGGGVRGGATAAATAEEEEEDDEPLYLRLYNSFTLGLPS